MSESSHPPVPAPAREPAPPPRSPWQTRDFRLIVAGQSLDQLGTGFTLVATPLLVLQLTHSAVWLAATAMALSAGAAAGGLAGSALADAFGRRAVLVASNAAQCVVTALMPLSLLSSGDPAAAMAIVIAGSAVLGIFGASFAITFNTLMPRLVDAPELPRANALVFTAQNAGLLVGPVLGGVLTGVGGVALAFEVDAATYLASLVSVVWLSRRPVGGGAIRGRWRDMGEGVATVWRSPLLRSLMTLGFFAYMGTGAVVALVVYRLTGELASGAATAGVVLGAVSAGGVVGSALAARLSPRGVGRAGRRWTEGRVVIAAVAGCGVLLLIMAIQRSPVAYAVLGGGAEACNWVAGIAAVSLTQRLVSARSIGRVMSIGYTVAWAGTLLGQAAMGALVGWVGAAAAFAVYGVEVILAALAMLLTPLAARPPVREPGQVASLAVADSGAGH